MKQVKCYRVGEFQWKSWCLACNMWCTYTTWIKAIRKSHSHAYQYCVMRSKPNA